MANKLLYLITECSGYENFEKCLKLCEMVEFSQLISINENTLNRMELYLQKKCSRMSLSERNELIGDKFANNPNMFRFSPGTRHRILGLIGRLEKIFMNPSFPITSKSIDEICTQISHNKNNLTTSIPSNSMKATIHKMYLGMEFNHTSLDSNACNTKPNKMEIDNLKIVAEKKVETYPNIFQRMDSLRRGEMKSPIKNDETHSVTFSSNDQKDKENLASKPSSNNNKRKLQTSDSLSHSDEPGWKIAKVLTPEYLNIPNKQISNTALKNSNISKENYKNKNHASATQLNQKLNDSDLTGKGNILKEIKLISNERIQNKDRNNSKKVLNSDSKIDSENNCVKSPQKPINRISKRLFDKNPVNKLFVNTKQSTEMMHILSERCTKQPNYKIPKSTIPIVKPKICSFDSRQLPINQTSNHLDRSLEPISNKVSNGRASTIDKPLLSVKSNITNKKQSGQSIFQSMPPIGSRKVQLSDYPFLQTEPVKQKKTSNTSKLLESSINNYKLQKNLSTLQVAEGRFLTPLSNDSLKDINNTSQSQKEQCKVFNNDHKSPKSHYSVSDSSHIDNLHSENQSNFQRNVLEQKISIDSFNDRAKTINKTELHKQTLFAYKTMPDLSVSSKKVSIDLTNDQNKQFVSPNPEFTVEPQWTTSSTFITNRFINSTKHQQPTFNKYGKMSNSQL